MDSAQPPASEIDRIADELVRARAAQTVSSAVPVPRSTAGAMRVQALVQERLALPVRGWKVAIGPHGVPVAAPLLDVYPDAARIDVPRTCVVEVEIAVVLGADIPERGGSAYVRSDLHGFIERVVLGIEVIGGRFDGATEVPFLSFLADNLGNRAYVVGRDVDRSALDDVAGRECLVTLDGQALHRAPAGHPAGDPLAPLLAYANLQNDCLGGLKAGQVVTTGSLCGVLPISAGGRLEARVATVGRVCAEFSIGAA